MFVLKIERVLHVPAPENRDILECVGDTSWEEWPTLWQSDKRATALRAQGAKVTIYQEV